MSGQSPGPVDVPGPDLRNEVTQLDPTHLEPPEPGPASNAQSGRRGLGSRLWSVLRGTPSGWVAVVMLALLMGTAALAPVLPLDPTTPDVSNMSAGPSAEHWLGTDEIGRDYLARVIDGGRISLLVGLAAMVASLLIGVTLGLTAGFLGGWVDTALMRLVDFLSSIPWIVLVIVASVFLRPGLLTIILVIGGLTWMPIARLVRAETLSAKERTYVVYADFIGLGRPTIVARHVVPAVIGTIIIAATGTISSAMMTEAALSFLGLGIQQPMSSWGSLLQTAQSGMQRAPLLAIVPGLLIMASVYSFNVLGNLVRRATTLEDL